MFECPVGGGTCIAIPFSVSGTGVSVASASPTSLAFGNVAINTTASQSVTITVDAGYRTEVASGSGLNAPFTFDFDTCGTGGGFAGPGTCNVNERFTPSALTASSGTTNVFECPILGGTCIGIPYTSSGTGVSVASASPTSLAFGNVAINTTSTLPVTITVDAGYRTEVASGSGLNAPFAFDFDTCGTGGGFAGPGTCNVKEKFTPSALTASSGTTNVFECPILGGTCIGIPYTSSGTGVSVASASPTSLAFGNVAINTTSTLPVTITVDAGYRTEVASGSGLNAPFAFDFDTCGTGGGFAGPGTCNVKEKFTPSALTASSGTTNVFECPILGGTCIGIPYTSSGTGVSVASASPTSLAFGNVAINTTSTLPVTITVDAGYRTEIASGSGINAPFAFDFDTCGTGGGFAGPGTCSVNEKYTPTSPSPSSGTTNVFECPIAGGTCIAIPYSVSGTGVQPILTLPADIVVSATHPGGVRVYYSPVVSASEGGVPVPVHCTAPAGATTSLVRGTFPIGTSTVTCTATDTFGNTVTGSFHVQVLGPADLLTALLRTVDGLGPVGVPLAVPLESAQESLGAGDTANACIDLGQFTVLVKASSGRHLPLTPAQGKMLTNRARDIANLLGC